MKLKVAAVHLENGGAKIGLFVDDEVHTQVWIRDGDSNEDVVKKLRMLAEEAQLQHELSLIKEDC